MDGEERPDFDSVEVEGVTDAAEVDGGGGGGCNLSRSLLFRLRVCKKIKAILMYACFTTLNAE